MQLSKNDTTVIQEIGSRISRTPGGLHTTEQLAIDAGLSKSKLKFGFRKIFNCSIHQFVIAARMNHALELLVNTEKKLLAIARECGYRHLSTFIGAFKNQQGCTPGSYRRQQEQSNI